MLYFGVLMLIAKFTSKDASNESFFVGNRNSPWFLVAYGMIGASLSGVTFISIPGAVVDNSFSYMQMVLGYLFGYAVIALVLLPIYYKLQLTSIYTYLEQRFNANAYKVGAFYFLISRIIGASFRLYLVAIVLQMFVFDALKVPFVITVSLTIFFIWIYSFKGGIKTIVWTDTLQTTFMLLAAALTIIIISSKLDWSFLQMIDHVVYSEYSSIIVSDSTKPNYFWKHFFGGAFITIVMTGLDQDMMQKNLSCRSLKDAQKNMFWMSGSLLIVNLVFLFLGALLYLYAGEMNLMQTVAENAEKPLAVLNNLGEVVALKKDQLFPFLAIEHLGLVVAILFLLGLIAAAYSSADSALTALTTSFCVDFLGFKNGDEGLKTRYAVHIGFSVVILLVILVFKALNNDSVINELFKVAGYTYGPLLGLFSLGILTKVQLNKHWVLPVCLLSPIVSYILNINSKEWFDYTFGFELLLLNGLITFIGLWLSSFTANLNPTTKV